MKKLPLLASSLALSFVLLTAIPAAAADARALDGSVSPANGATFPAGTKTVPFAWKLDLPGDCNTDLPWRNGILGTGLFIGPPGSPFNDATPHQGLFGRDAADDLKLEVSDTALLLWPGEYTMYAYGSCVSRANSATRIEFETPHTTFFVKAKPSTLKIRSSGTIAQLGSKGIDLFLTCGTNCSKASFVATVGGKALGTVTRLAPADHPAPFLPMPNQPALTLKLNKAAKAKLAKLKTANIKVTATVALQDGETHVVTAKAAFAR